MRGVGSHRLCDEKYGTDRVAQIITLVRWQPGAIKMGRALDIPITKWTELLSWFLLNSYDY